MAQEIINPNDLRYFTLHAGVRDVINNNANNAESRLGDNVVIVKSVEDFGVIDSAKQYVIDGVIDLGSTTIEIPAGGISIRGYNFDISRIISTEDNFTAFESAVGGSGNILVQDIDFSTSGENSQVWDIKSESGFEAFEFERINYTDCTKVGVIDNYRQGLEIGSGRFGGTPTLELVGEWVGGFRVTTSIVRGLSASMTDPIFKAGAGFTMGSRFLSDINCYLPASAAFLDFSQSNFLQPSSVQLLGCVISRNGVFDAEDTNIIPNMSSGDLAADFIGNKGIQNTFVGGRSEVTTEAETTINTAGVYVDIAGTFTASELAHFDSPSNGQLRNIGDNPREYRFFGSFILDGGANNVVSIRVRKWDDSASEFTNSIEQTRQVNSLVGSRDVAFFTLVDNITLDQNDYVFLQVANLDDTTNITLEEGSYFFLNQR